MQPPRTEPACERDTGVCHLLVLARAGDEERLDAALRAILAWRPATVIAPFPAPRPLDCRWVEVDGAGVAAAFDRAVTQTTGGWLALADAGVIPVTDAWPRVAGYLERRPAWRLVYSDSDSLPGAGGPGAPRSGTVPLFRPDFNLDLLRSSPGLGAMVWVQREAFLALGGFGSLAGAYAYDLALRLLDRFGEEAIGHLDDVLYHVPDGTPPPSVPACRQALEAHLSRRDVHATVAAGTLPGTFRVQYALEMQPLVSIVVPTRDKLELLAACLDGILHRTDYAEWELLVVDNGSCEARTLEYLDRLAATHAPRVRLLRFPGEFNFSAICNLAAREARGEHLLLLNNDTEVLHPDWLHLMVSHANRPEIGVVGARLFYAEPPLIQHAGVILGLGGIADHILLGAGDRDPGYMGRAQCDQELSAVTGACLMIRRSLYESLGGLDAVRFPVCFNDIDLCLRVRERGLKVLWTPHVQLKHHAGQTVTTRILSPDERARALQRFHGEREAMLRTWLPQLARDPAYNRHLCLRHRDYRPDESLEPGWDPGAPDELPRVLAWCPAGACSGFDAERELGALRAAGRLRAAFIHPGGRSGTDSPRLVEIVRAAPDIFSLPVTAELLSDPGLLDALRRLTSIRIVLHAGEVLLRGHVPDPGPLLGMAHRVVAASPQIAGRCASHQTDVRLAPTRSEDWLSVIVG